MAKPPLRGASSKTSSGSSAVHDAARMSSGVGGRYPPSCSSSGSGISSPQSGSSSGSGASSGREEARVSPSCGTRRNIASVTSSPLMRISSTPMSAAPMPESAWSAAARSSAWMYQARLSVSISISVIVPPFCRQRSRYFAMQSPSSFIFQRRPVLSPAAPLRALSSPSLSFPSVPRRPSLPRSLSLYPLSLLFRCCT